MKLKQVMINILGNSVKFTEKSGSVTLTAEQLSEEKRNVYRQIHYEGHRHRHGQGIYPKIFESFSQEDATTTNKYGGSGLGMAITKNFVEMMNGSVSVESEKGVGTECSGTAVKKSTTSSVK